MNHDELASRKRAANEQKTLFAYGVVRVVINAREWVAASCAVARSA